MQKRVLVPLAEGFEEIETVTVVDILRRAGAKVEIAALKQGLTEGSRKIKIAADVLFDDVREDEFDMIVLPGGQPGTNLLNESPSLKQKIRTMHKENRFVTAICAAPLVLYSSSILQSKTITCHPSVKDQLKDISCVDQRVVVDGNIITSQSPGTAMEFAFKLIEKLFGDKRMRIVNEGVLAKL